MTQAVLLDSLRAACDAGREALQAEFRARGDALATLAGRTALADRTIRSIVSTLFPFGEPQASGYCLVAIGGYGRRALFPSSDLDVLLLCADARAAEAVSGPGATLVRMLWDLGWRTAVTSRLLEECDRFEQDNPEFTISLLDSRCVAGDAALAAALRQKVLPALVAREQNALVRSLAEMTRERHEKHGNTLFHLEPNLKDAPGGLRDFDVACWATAMNELSRHRAWTAPESGWGELLGEAAGAGYRFIAAVRVFLHYQNGRDDNRLTYDLQEEAAARGIGTPGAAPQPAEQWMRAYFRHARTIARLEKRRMDEALARPSLYRAFEDWRARLSNADFSVHHNRAFCRRPTALAEPAFLLGLYEFVARHGLEPAVETEAAVEQIVASGPYAAGWPGDSAAAGPPLRRILTLPSAGVALRAMHRVGVLDALLPEFRAVDSLVIRDLYHRYTVDEHTLLTIEGLHALRHATFEPDRRFAEILAEVEQPELLYLSLLLHDVGKGMPGEDHVLASVEAAGRACRRFGLAPYERGLVTFLIRNHLEMSLTLQRRDIFDPEAVRVFSELVGTSERLKMLCLLTYADIRSVNPDALTPWKAEMLWQLYAAAANYLARSVDGTRIAGSAASDRDLIEVVRGSSALAALAKPLAAFLDGFPRRYLKLHASDEIAAHFEMAHRLEERLVAGETQGVEAQLRERRGQYELTVVARDRAGLFAGITGTLSTWGMNILKADAFSNRAGLVLDTFVFADLYNTLTLNPEERGRLLGDVEDVVAGRRPSEASGHPRRAPRGPAARSRSAVATEVRFDNSCSAASTVVELVARDRPGLLHHISELLSGAGCNIEAALIDTQGEKAIDVFYLTQRGKKLGDAEARSLRKTLLHGLEQQD
ncbi:MAG TPA: [protein-PII] uridylyltransferase [Candidatus Acidoferrales bacterium]|nr:[protein-PII] uridylyltransferase [Candidatus Acidoferrales bacterium]